MNQTTIEAWIEKWGTNLDWEAKAALREDVQAEKMSDLKGQVSDRTTENAQLELHANQEFALKESRIRVQSIIVVQQFIELITKNELTFQEATNCFRWARWNVFNEGGMPTGDDSILKDSIGELEKSFCVKDTPENRMEILHEINVRKEKIASDFASVLCQEQLSVSEAISILKNTEAFIMQSRFSV